MSNLPAQSTMLVDLDNWDIVLDSAANFARADPGYSTAQDVASAEKTFLSEVWYDKTLGLPYFTQILGRAPPLAVFIRLLQDEALEVPGVVTAQPIVTSYDNVEEQANGQIILNDSQTVGI